jgi:hypothetical protein
MKTTLLLAVLALLTVPALSQGKKYTKAMQAAIEMMQGADNPAGELEAAGDFEKIASDYPDQWLPYYHAARILITGSFVETEAERKEALLEQAKAHVLKAEDLVRQDLDNIKQ